MLHNYHSVGYYEIYIKHHPLKTIFLHIHVSYYFTILMLAHDGITIMAAKGGLLAISIKLINAARFNIMIK